MKKRALRKDFYMEIKRSFNRFISIFFIVALGVAFYSGIQASAPDMEESGDAYFDQQKLMDLRVVGTMGLTEGDVEALTALEGVKKAEGAYMTDVLFGEEASQKVIHMESIAENFQKLQAEEGNLPVKAGECFLDATLAESFGLQVGDTITIREDAEEDEDKVLKRDLFTVVGIGASPAYISFSKGNTTLGSGEVSGFCYILPEDFDLEVYTQIFAEVSGASEKTAFTQEYEDLVDKIKGQVEGIEKERCEIRFQEVKEEADEKIQDAEQELEDGKKEAEEKLEDARADIAEGEEKLADGKEQLEQGKKDLEDAKQKVEDGKTELEEKEGELADAKAQVAEGWTKLSEGKQQLADAEAQYESQKASAQVEIDSGQVALDVAKVQYQQGMEQYESGLSQLNDAYIQLDLQETMLAQAAELSEEGKAAYEAAKPGLDATRAQLDAQSQTLTASKEQLDSAKAEIDANEAQIQSAIQQLEEGAAQIEAARTEITTQEAALNEAQAQVDDGQQKIDEGWAELADGEQEIADAEADIADAETTIKENEEKLADGKKDFEEAEQEVKDTVADGEEKIADAKKELEDLEEPEWTVSTRADLPDYTGYGDNADRMRNIGKVFPVLFFLVAALISLTTMTRMVEEERTQIGTLKALGYGKLPIARKYIGYALLATLGGSAFGVLVGEKLLPFIIIYAYTIMYQHMGIIVLDYKLDHAVIATSVAVFCTMAGTVSACYRELAATPAVLMRPPAPKEGKRVLLERIGLIWNHLNFTWKSTIRNLFRYKKRFFMTVFGIGGCMALLLVGFGLRDSIMDIAVLQYQEIQTYDGMLILDEDASLKEKESLSENLASREDVTAYRNVYMKKMLMKGPDGQYDTYLMVPETLENFDTFVNTRERISQESVPLTDEGLILTEKTASLLGLKAGDTIQINQDGTNVTEVPIQSICENYMLHYAYMSPALYEKCFGAKPEYNNIIFCTESKEEAEIEQTGQALLKEAAALSITYTGSFQDRLDDMLGTLDSVIVVLIVSAGMLAFVVLYNLNNININERKRELATIKVLGFYDREVSAYVYRENILLTLIGALAGVGLGFILHRFVVITVEIDECMFGRNIQLWSYLISVLITCGFSFFVNVVMHFKLKKIDMVESLKSVE